MRILLLILVLFFTNSAILEAQAIHSKGFLGGYTFTQNGEKLGYKDLTEIMKFNVAAYPVIKKARAKNKIANVLGFMGGGLVGWPVGDYLADEEPNWTLAAVGIGVVFFSVSLAATASKQAKKAVDLYNSSLDETSFHKYKPQFDFVVSGNQIGFVMRF
jgi:hypothetical protein